MINPLLAVGVASSAVDLGCKVIDKIANFSSLHKSESLDSKSANKVSFDKYLTNAFEVAGTDFKAYLESQGVSDLDSLKEHKAVLRDCLLRNANIRSWVQEHGGKDVITINQGADGRLFLMDAAGQTLQFENSSTEAKLGYLFRQVAVLENNWNTQPGASLYFLSTQMPKTTHIALSLA